MVVSLGTISLLMRGNPFFMEDATLIISIRNNKGVQTEPFGRAEDLGEEAEH